MRAPSCNGEYYYIGRIPPYSDVGISSGSSEAQLFLGLLTTASLFDQGGAMWLVKTQGTIRSITG